MKFNIDLSFKHSSGIYIITNDVDDRIYIGSTINFWKRFSDHKRKLTLNTHANKHIQAFSKKYGIESLSFNLLLLCKNTCLLFNEKQCIELLKPKFNVKPIIERKYFDDGIIYNEEYIMQERAKKMDEWWKISFPEEYKEAQENKLKYPPLPHLNFAEEMSYYHGEPPFCVFPREEEVILEPERTRNTRYEYLTREQKRLRTVKRNEALKWARGND